MADGIPQSLLGGSSQLGYVVNNHGDRRSPKWGCGTPYKWPNLIHGLFSGGDPITTYVRPGMILQVDIQSHPWRWSSVFLGPPKKNGVPNQKNTARTSGGMTGCRSGI